MAEHITNTFFAAARHHADAGPATHAELAGTLSTHGNVLPRLMRNLTAAVAGEVARDARTAGVRDAAAAYASRAAAIDDSLVDLPPAYSASVERQLETRISQLREELASRFHYRPTRIEKAALVVYLTKTLKTLQAYRKAAATAGVSRIGTSATVSASAAPKATVGVVRATLSSSSSTESVNETPAPASAQSEIEQINRLALLEQIEAELRSLRKLLTTWPPPQDKIEEASRAVSLVRMKMKLQASRL